MAHRLVRQLYGIATAGNVFGGPRGVWIECIGCDESSRIVGSPNPLDMTNADVAKVYRAHGWTGRGSSMKRAKCPKCAGRKPVSSDQIAA